MFKSGVTIKFMFFASDAKNTIEQAVDKLIKTVPEFLSEVNIKNIVSEVSL